MIRERFPLSSEQMELLLAFESAGNLEKLADMMARDPSVVSRNLQKLSAHLPVLVKVVGRWQITPFGRQLNDISREHLARLESFVGKNKKSKSQRTKISPNSLLIVVNAQKALYDPAWGRRSNLGAEENILRVLEHWRKTQRPMVHIKHASESPDSFFYKKSPGVDFVPSLEPKGNELVMEKSKANAFAGTDLEKLVRKINPESLIMVGFTVGECIDATVRYAIDLGFKTCVVGDATASFDIIGPNGKLHKAEKVQKSTLASLHALSASILDTEALLRAQ